MSAAASASTPAPEPGGASSLTPHSVVVASRRVAYVLAGRGFGGAASALWVTGDAGRHFAQVRLPEAHRKGRRLQVSGVTFVDSRHGYAILGAGTMAAPHVLTVTADGAHSWHPARLPDGDGDRVAAVAGHGRRVFVATVRCHGHLLCTDVRLYTALSAGRHWRRVEGAIPARDSADGVGLAAWGASVWLMIGVGATPHPLQLWSGNAGRTFTARPGPGAVSCTATATSPRVMWTSCTTGLLRAFTRTVTDQASARLRAFGANTTNTYLDPLSDQVAYFQSSAGRYRGLRLTVDAGHTNRRVAALPGGARAADLPLRVAFFSRRTGLAIASGRLVRTDKAGRTWTRAAASEVPPRE